MVNKDIVKEIAICVAKTNGDPWGEIEAEPEEFKAALADMESKGVISRGINIIDITFDIDGISKNPNRVRWDINKENLKKEYGIEID